MAKAVNKTVKTRQSVSAFLAAQPDAGRRRDCRTIAAMMRQATGAPPKMWGPSIVGFGDAHYKYASGREGDWFEIGFAPRKTEVTIYGLGGVKRYPALLRKLGAHSLDGSCLHITRLEDIDLGILKKLMSAGVRDLRQRRGAA
jgi:hypothetical protein